MAEGDHTGKGRKLKAEVSNQDAPERKTARASGERENEHTFMTGGQEENSDNGADSTEMKVMMRQMMGMMQGMRGDIKDSNPTASPYGVSSLPQSVMMSELNDWLDGQRQLIEQVLKFNIEIAGKCTKMFPDFGLGRPAGSDYTPRHLAQRSHLRLGLLNRAVDGGSLSLAGDAREHFSSDVLSDGNKSPPRVKLPEVLSDGNKSPHRVKLPEDGMVQSHMHTNESLCTPLLRESEPVRESKSDDCAPDKSSRRDSRRQSVLAKRNRLSETSRSRFECMFPEVDDLRDAVHATLNKRSYNVESLYDTTGCWQALARNNAFKNLAFFVIVLNTIWIGVETDLNNAVILTQASPVFQIVDNAFCAFFSFEILARFLAFTHKRNALSDGWFVFDALLVTMMVWETWILVFLNMYLGFASSDSPMAKNSAGAHNSGIFRLLRLIRLTRVARATRLLTSFPELLILVTGMVAGIRSVLAVLCFLSLVIYVFAIVFTLTFRGAGFASGVFDSVPQSMNTLLLQVLCGPDADFMKQIFEVSVLFYLLFLCFVLVAVLTAMNMLTGILVDVVSNIAEESHDQSFAKLVEEQIARLAEDLDQDNNGLISKEEFDEIVSDPEAMTVFTELGIDVVSLADFARFIYAQCEELRYSAFAQLVTEFRRTKVATLKDFSNMRRYLSMELIELSHGLERSFLKACKPPDARLE